MTDRTRAHDDQPTGPERLSAAVDRFVESGFAAADDSPEQSTLAALFSMLDLEPAEPESRGLLINVTIARISRQRDDAALLASIGPDEDHAALTGPSTVAIDAILTNENPERLNKEHGARAERLLSSLDLEPGVSVEERESLVGRTLSTIQTDIDRDDTRFRMEAVRELQRVRPRISLSDLTTVAAVLLIAGAIFWPMVAGLREASHQQLCAADLSAAGVAFAMYANDHDDRLPARNLPTATPRTQRAQWWNVGESSASHSSNLFELVRNGYTSLSQLSCPGNEHAPVEFISEHQSDWSAPEEVSYSYQLFAGTPPRLNETRNAVVLTDKSPIIPRARAGELFNPEARSLNHLGRGQNVLMSDLHVVFTDEPYRPGTRDNFWLPRQLEVGIALPLTGYELPADRVDAFVGP